MLSYYATRKISPICKISTFFEGFSFLNPRSHLKIRKIEISFVTQTYQKLQKELELQKAFRPFQAHSALKKNPVAWNGLKI